MRLASRHRLIGTSHGGIAVSCAVIAVLAGFLAMVASQDGWPEPSAMVNISSQEPLAAIARSDDSSFRLVPLAQHYDGAYYYATARDPFLTGQAHTLIDQPAYRYGHPLHGWLAALLSLGKPRLIPLALLLLSLIGLAVAAWAVSRLAVQFGRTPWAGVVVAVSPGLLYAATVDTTEALGAALIALVLLAWVRGRIGLAALLLAAVCLDREQYVVIPLGLCLWEVVRSYRTRRPPPRLAMRAFAVIVGPAVLVVWYLYVHQRLGQWPGTRDQGNVGPPFVGFQDTLQRATGLSRGSFDGAEIGTVTPALLLAVLLLVAVAAVLALRLRTVLDGPMLGFAALTSTQGWRTLLYPHDLVRTTAIAVLFSLAVLFTRPRRAGSGGGAATDPEPGAFDG